MNLDGKGAASGSRRWLVGVLLSGVGAAIMGTNLWGQNNYPAPNDPRYDRNDPRYAAPRNTDPRYDRNDPRYNAPRNTDPRYNQNDPRYNTPQYTNPRNIAPRYNNPRIAANDPRYRKDGGQENVDDLVRTLIDNDVQNRSQLQNNSYYNPLQPTTLPPGYSPNPNLTNPTREMLAARNVLANVSRDADQLAILLGDDLQRVPGVRPYLDDVLRLRGRVALLAQRSQQLNDHQAILPDLQELDRTWRLLSYRLSQLRGLNPRTITQIQQLNTYAKQLGHAFEIAPQLDRQNLLRATAELAADLHNLMGDIEIEVPRSQQQIDLLLRGRRIEQQARLVANTVADTGDYQTVIGQYREFQRVWQPYATDLRPLNNRYLERGVRRVNDVDNSIHELLWMPKQIDADKLLYLSSVLKRDVDDFFVRAPLKLMIKLPNSDQVLTVSDEFYGVCENFTDIAQRGGDPQQMVDAYRYIEDSWRAFSGLFQHLESQAAQQVLLEIGNDITTMGQALQVQGGGNNNGGYNQHNVVEIAASLDNLARHLENDIGQWLSVRTVNYRDNALHDAAQFRQSCQRIHEMLTLPTSDPREVAREADQLTRDWKFVYEDIQRCNTAEKPHLQRAASQISPQVVELRTLLVQ